MVVDAGAGAGAGAIADADEGKRDGCCSVPLVKLGELNAV